MRDYIITINNDGTVTAEPSLQYTDEHCATQLTVVLNDELKAQGISYYTLCFNIGALSENPYGIKLTSDMITESGVNGFVSDGVIYFPLPSALTAFSSLKAQVEAHSLDANGKLTQTVKSPVFYLDFSSSVSGEEEFIPLSSSGFISTMHHAISQMNKTTQEADSLCEKINSAFENGEMNGFTFYPEISENGELTWTNDGGLDNPPSFLIKGEKGESAKINGCEAITLSAGENISLEQNENVLSIGTNFSNQSTLSQLRCEAAESDLVMGADAHRLKFQGNTLRYNSDGRVITKIEKITNENGKSYLRMSFNSEIVFFEDFPDFIDIPVAGFTSVEDSSGSLTLNGGQLEFEASEYIPLPLINSTETSAVLEPNTAYSFGEAAELSLTLADGAENTLSEYIFSFISGETPTVLTLPADIIWANELTIEANKRYEINIANGFALWVCAEVSA